MNYPSIEINSDFSKYIDEKHIYDSLSIKLFFY